MIKHNTHISHKGEGTKAQQQYFNVIRNVRNSEWQKKWKINTRKLYDIKPCIKEQERAQNNTNYNT